jgi:hypothetical protein
MDFYTVQFNLLKSKNPNIKDASILTYLVSIRKICKELFNSNTCSLMYFKDYPSVFEYLNENIKSLSTRKNTCTAIIVLLKANAGKYPFINEVLPFYSTFHKELAVKQADFYLDNEKTDKEKLNWVTQKEIKDTIIAIKNKIEIFNDTRKYIDLYQQFVVLSLYTLLPPVRNDFALAKVIHIEDLDPKTLNPSINYINFTSKTQAELLLLNYKTAKVYGIKRIVLPEALTEIVFNYQVAKKKFFKRNIETLLVNTTDAKDMTKNGLTKFLNKIFAPKKVSTTLLRKSFISEKYPVINTTRDRENDAFVMGHSIGMAGSVYSKK